MTRDRGFVFTSSAFSRASGSTAELVFDTVLLKNVVLLRRATAQDYSRVARLASSGGPAVQHPPSRAWPGVRELNLEVAADRDASRCRGERSTNDDEDRNNHERIAQSHEGRGWAERLREVTLHEELHYRDYRTTRE